MLLAGGAKLSGSIGRSVSPESSIDWSDIEMSFSTVSAFCPSFRNSLTRPLLLLTFNREIVLIESPVARDVLVFRPAGYIAGWNDSNQGLNSHSK
jgi:hypothetical protein